MSPSRKPPTKPPSDEKPRPTSIATPLAEKTGLSLPPADAVVALRVVGASAPEIALSPLKRRFLLGSDMKDPDVTLKVSSRMNGDPNAKEIVSRVHVLIQRQGSELAIKDQGSTNGTFIDGRREADFHLKAGKTFRVADVTLLAMDEQMMLLRPDLQWVLGFDAHAQVDDALTRIATGDPLLLLGEPDCEQRWLAEQIHCTSARRHKGFVAVPALDATATALAAATDGTAYLDLHEFKRGSARLAAPFVTELFGKTYNARPIVAAPDTKTAVAHLGEDRVRQMKMVVIPPIRERRGDVPRILTSLFRRPPLDSKAKISQLPDDQIAILQAFDWPDNFDDLRRNAPRILALVQSDGNKAAAARLLGVKPQSFNDALKRIGL